MRYFPDIKWETASDIVDTSILNGKALIRVLNSLVTDFWNFWRFLITGHKMIVISARCNILCRYASQGGSPNQCGIGNYSWSKQRELIYCKFSFRSSTMPNETKSFCCDIRTTICIILSRAYHFLFYSKVFKQSNLNQSICQRFENVHYWGKLSCLKNSAARVEKGGLCSLCSADSKWWLPQHLAQQYLLHSSSRKADYQACWSIWTESKP